MVYNVLIIAHRRVENLQVRKVSIYFIIDITPDPAMQFEAES